MRIIAMSDLHFKSGYDDKLKSLVQTIGKADMVLLAGDLTHFGSAPELNSVLTLISKISPVIYAVPGNCDTQEIADGLNARNIDLEGRAILEGFCLVNGLGGVPKWRNKDYSFSEEELAQTLERGTNEANGLLNQNPGTYARILLSHTPPYGSKADRAMYMKHVGSLSVAEHLQKVRYDVCICGHIHECVGVTTWSNAQLVNCGPARRGYYVDINIDSTTNGALNIDIKSKRDGSRFWI